jgi:hypothetical protein
VKGEPELDRDTVKRVASAALARPVDDVDWQLTPLSYVVYNPVSLALFRVSGTATAGASALPWSCVLKISRAHDPEQLSRLSEADRERVLDALRWDRECEVYASRLLESLPPGVAAPRCYGVDRERALARIWMEDVAETESSWSVARYGLAARHLGRFNGTFLGQPELPQDWLSRDWIRKWSAYFARSARAILDDERIWSVPVVAEHFATQTRSELSGLLTMRDRWFDALDRLPITLSHLDAFRANMLSRAAASGTETVLIDWAFVGYAPLAADIATLVIASVFYHGEALAAADVEDAALDGYTQGLKDAGHDITSDDIVRAYVLNSVVRWTFILGPLVAAGRPDREAAVSRAIRRPYPEVVRSLAERSRYLCAISRRLKLD